MSAQLTSDDLSNLLDADFDKGVLIWKPRDSSMFKSKNYFLAWNAKNAGKVALTADHPDGYKTGIILGKHYLAHRVLYAMFHGEWPEFIDHINGNRSDNRIENLRAVSRSENGRNVATPQHNTSGHIGVAWNSRDKRWTAYITINRKRKHLGNFLSKDDAIECRLHHQKLLGFHPNHGRVL